MSPADFNGFDGLVAAAVGVPLLIAAVVQWRRRDALRVLLQRERVALGGDAVEVVVASSDERAPRLLSRRSLPSGALGTGADGLLLRIVSADGTRRALQFAADAVTWVGLAKVGGFFHEWIALGRGEQRIWVAVERTGGSAALYRRLVGAEPPRPAADGSCFDGTLVYPPREALTERLRRLAPALLFGGILFALGRADLAWLKARLAASPDDDYFGAASILSLMLIQLLLLVWGVAIVGVLQSGSVLRAGRWPNADPQVVAPTRVIRGWCLRLRNGVLPALLTVGLLVASAQSVQLFDMISRNALDRQAAWLLRPVFARRAPAAMAESPPSISTAGHDPP
jgi:hypothetical protein